MYPHRHTPSDGVLEIPYQDFPGTYQRTNTVPAECPNAAIVWVNSIDQLVQAGTSWYELVRAGTYQKSVILHCLPIQIGWYELVRAGTSWYVPKVGNFTLFAHTNWLVRWYAGTVPDRTKVQQAYPVHVPRSTGKDDGARSRNRDSLDLRRRRRRRRRDEKRRRVRRGKRTNEGWRRRRRRRCGTKVAVKRRGR